MIILQGILFTVGFILVLTLGIWAHRKWQYWRFQKAINAYMYYLKQRNPAWSDSYLKKRAQQYFKTAMAKHNLA